MRLCFVERSRKGIIHFSFFRWIAAERPQTQMPHVWRSDLFYLSWSQSLWPRFFCKDSEIHMVELILRVFNWLAWAKLYQMCCSSVWRNRMPPQRHQSHAVLHHKATAKEANGSTSAFCTHTVVIANCFFVQRRYSRILESGRMTALSVTTVEWCSETKPSLGSTSSQFRAWYVRSHGKPCRLNSKKLDVATLGRKVSFFEPAESQKNMDVSGVYLSLIHISTQRLQSLSDMVIVLLTRLSLSFVSSSNCLPAKRWAQCLHPLSQAIQCPGRVRRIQHDCKHCDSAILPPSSLDTAAESHRAWAVTSTCETLRHHETPHSCLGFGPKPALPAFSSLVIASKMKILPGLSRVLNNSKLRNMFFNFSEGLVPLGAGFCPDFLSSGSSPSATASCAPSETTRTGAFQRECISSDRDILSLRILPSSTENWIQWYMDCVLLRSSMVYRVQTPCLTKVGHHLWICVGSIFRDLPPQYRMAPHEQPARLQLKQTSRSPNKSRFGQTQITVVMHRGDLMRSALLRFWTSGNALLRFRATSAIGQKHRSDTFGRHQGLQHWEKPEKLWICQMQTPLK